MLKIFEKQDLILTVYLLAAMLTLHIMQCSHLESKVKITNLFT